MSNDTPAPDPHPAVKGRSFSSVRTLLVAMPLVVVILAGAGWWTLWDGEHWLREQVRPRLVPVTGTVAFGGELLKSGQVTTKLMNRNQQGAIAFIEGGKFALMTDVDGRYVEGAYVGRHKVTVADYEPQRGPSPPPLLTPDEYAAFGTTPLEIDVSRSPDKNVFAFTLKGEPPARPQRPAAGAGGGGRGGFGGPPGGGGRRGGGPPRPSAQPESQPETPRG